MGPIDLHGLVHILSRTALLKDLDRDNIQRIGVNTYYWALWCEYLTLPLPTIQAPQPPTPRNQPTSHFRVPAQAVNLGISGLSTRPCETTYHSKWPLQGAHWAPAAAQHSSLTGTSQLCCGGQMAVQRVVGSL